MPDVTIGVAAKELGLSKFTMYRLPKTTPGLYIYGRSVRVNVEELRQWAREQAQAQVKSLGEEANDSK
ncbi:MAG TPA: hypothetical protein PKK23_15765 [Nitrospirales bacterium]|nr:hypothetical protein [Nitrospiraceae bacterium]HNP30503.1 hypothetical protein [Nitrospirales bacterium]